MNTAEPTVFKSSPQKTGLLAVVGVAMTTLSAIVAFGSLGPTNLLVAICAWVGVPFFALCTTIAIWRATMLRGPVVTIAPAGIRDLRVSPDVIPWIAIEAISTWQSSSQSMMVLAIDPVVERGLTLNLIVRATRGANRWLGADGLVIAPTGLQTDYDTLLLTTAAYLNAWRR